LEKTQKYNVIHTVPTIHNEKDSVTNCLLTTTKDKDFESLREEEKERGRVAAAVSLAHSCHQLIISLGRERESSLTSEELGTQYLFEFAHFFSILNTILTMLFISVHSALSIDNTSQIK
jgi:hypothetical protein